MASLRLQICPTTTSLTPLSHPPDLLAKTREPLLLLPRSTQKPHLKRKKKTLGLPGSYGSTGFCRVVAPAGLLTNPDRSSHPVDPPGRSGFKNYGSKCKMSETCQQYHQLSESTNIKLLKRYWYILVQSIQDLNPFTLKKRSHNFFLLDLMEIIRPFTPQPFRKIN